MELFEMYDIDRKPVGMQIVRVKYDGEEEISFQMCGKCTSVSAGMDNIGGVIVRGYVHVALLDNNRVLTLTVCAPGYYNSSYGDVYHRVRDTLKTITAAPAN